ncbi:hypothetical protein [Empedobacter falsenii]
MKNWRRFVVLIDIFGQKKEDFGLTFLDLRREGCGDLVENSEEQYLYIIHFVLIQNI